MPRRKTNKNKGPGRASKPSKRKNGGASVSTKTVSEIKPNAQDTKVKKLSDQAYEDQITATLANVQNLLSRVNETASEKPQSKVAQPEQTKKPETKPLKTSLPKTQAEKPQPKVAQPEQTKKPKTKSPKTSLPKTPVEKTQPKAAQPEQTKKAKAKSPKKLSPKTLSPNALAPTSADWQQRLEQSLENTHTQLANQLQEFSEKCEKQIHELQEIVLKSLKNKPPAIVSTKHAQESSDESADDALVNVNSEWERRKHELFLELEPEATDCETETGMTETVTKSSETIDTKTKIETQSPQKPSSKSSRKPPEKSAKGPTESQDKTPPTKTKGEVEELRAKLIKKLREAEVELSINRAKMDQQRAKLERQQLELERREKSLASRYPTVDEDGVPQRMGVLDRLTRHLNTSKNPDTL